MSNIKLITVLENYNKILNGIEISKTVILTENGKSKYVIMI